MRIPGGVPPPPVFRLPVGCCGEARLDLVEVGAHAQGWVTVVRACVRARCVRACARATCWWACARLLPQVVAPAADGGLPQARLIDYRKFK